MHLIYHRESTWLAQDPVRSDRVRPKENTLEIQYIAVRYFAISSISRIVRGPQIYHDHKKKKISKCFFYLIWKKKKKKKNDCNSLRYWFFAHIQTWNRVTHYDQTIQLVSISTQIDNNWQSININRRTCHNQCHNWVHVLSAQSINDVHAPQTKTVLFRTNK